MSAPSASRIFRPVGPLAGLLVCWLACALLPVAGAERQDSGLLWRIVGPDAQVSYLFGTMHSDDPRITRLAPPVSLALVDSDRVLLELDMAPATLLESARLMMYPDGGRLDDEVPADLLARVHALAARKGWPPQVLAQLRPWAAAVSLGAPPRGSGVTLDAKLASLARAAGKPVLGLETVAEQLTTFNALDAEQQLTLLRDLVDDFDALPDYYRQLQQAYVAGDLARILDLGLQDLDKPDAALVRLLVQGLLVDRNRRMVERMQPYLAKGNAFIAVGALHLPGQQGILSRLRSLGYRVEPVQ